MTSIAHSDTKAKITRNPLIKATALTKVYEAGTRVCALDNVSFELASGEFVAIIGPSGSGKSTLLNLLGLLDEPTSGRICFAGQDVEEIRGDARADFRRERVGFIFQLFHLVPTLTALENVLLPLLPYRRSLSFDPNLRAQELLAIVGLGRRSDHLPSELSGGEQQRVAIARALINHPDLLLADEPTGNLDRVAGAETMALLRQMNKEHGVTILLVTHDPVISDQADRVVSLVDGRLL